MKPSSSYNNSQLNHYHYDEDSESLALKTYNVTFGQQSLFTSGESRGPLESIVDISSRFIRVPNSIFQNLIKQLGDNAKCSTEFCYFDGECKDTEDSNLQPLNIRFEGDQFFAVHPHEYLIKGKDFKLNNVCLVAIVSHDVDDYVILGQTFLKGFYTTFDYLNKGIIFSLHTESKASISYEAVYHSSSILVPILITLAVVLVGLGVGFFFWKKRQNKKVGGVSEPLL